jgi:deoxycytidine triphosphate deaminase
LPFNKDFFVNLTLHVAGVVDEDYRGVIKVVLFNHSDSPFEVKSGDRIAQFICERIYYPDLEEVKVSYWFKIKLSSSNCTVFTGTN